MQERLEFLSVSTISPYLFLFKNLYVKMEEKNENSRTLLE